MCVRLCSQSDKCEIGRGLIYRIVLEIKLNIDFDLNETHIRREKKGRNKYYE